MTSQPSTLPPADPRAAARQRRTSLILALVAAATITVPFLFWKQTWFGEPLPDEMITQYLAESDKPRHIQQALVQIQEKMERGDPSAEQWYLPMAALKDSPVVELRVTLAWVLGTDNRSDLLRQTLLAMLYDDEMLVRRNAALSLVRFGDDTGREEIRAMLQPFTLRAGQDGVMRYRLPEGTTLDKGTLLGRIEGPGGAEHEIRSPLPGALRRQTVSEGAAVKVGDEIAVISPGEDHVWEALRALLLIGREEDLALVEPFAQPGDYPATIKQQASLAAAEIRKRAATPHPTAPSAR